MTITVLGDVQSVVGGQRSPAAGQGGQVSLGSLHSFPGPSPEGNAGRAWLDRQASAMLRRLILAEDLTVDLTV